MRHRTASVFLVLLALVAVPGRSGAGETLPIDIFASYELALTPDIGCRGFHIDGYGGALGSPSSVAAWEDHACADLMTSPGRITIRDGALTLSNPFGDRIDMTYFAVADAIPDISGYLHPYGAFSVTGGEGAFAGATGSGVFTSVTHPIVRATTAHLQGSLTLP